MYNDALVAITENSLVIKDYYFPYVSKQISFDDIITVQVLEPDITNGKWRIWGMGMIPIWFALDWKRPSRDVTFVVNLKDIWLRSGFTSESSADVIRELTDKGIPVYYN